MISTLSKQGGRRYPQMGATGLVFHGWLPGVGETTPAPEVDVTLWGRIRQDARRRSQIEREDAELIRIVRLELGPKLLSRWRRGKI